MRDDDHQSIPRLHDREGGRLSKKLEEEAAALAAYARGEREVDQFGGPRPRQLPNGELANPELYTRHAGATVTPLKPATTPSLQDEILVLLDALVADIRSGKVTPLYLILSYGDDRGDSVAYDWHGLGMNRFEMIGHLTAEATALAMETDE